jgi:hypothetical protein
VALQVSEIVIDCSSHDLVVDFWLAALDGYQRTDVNKQYVAITPDQPAIGRPSILFQKVPEPKVVKNRVHLDLRGESMSADVQRLADLGATVIAERSLGDAIRWTVLADPEGNEFCVSGAR